MMTMNIWSTIWVRVYPVPSSDIRMSKSWLWKQLLLSRYLPITFCYTLPWSSQTRTQCIISLLVKYLGKNIQNWSLFASNSISNFPNQKLKNHWSLRNWFVIFLILMKIMSLVILFLMNPCSWLVRSILGTGIFFSISKPNVSNPIFHMMNIVISDTILNATLLSTKICIVMVLILSYDVV